MVMITAMNETIAVCGRFTLKHAVAWSEEAARAAA